MRIATRIGRFEDGEDIWLHPLFGAGEDRNPTQTCPSVSEGWLHPLFGAGEDRNRADTLAAMEDLPGLHPLFGAGEDRNSVHHACQSYISNGCTRSSERVRIATGGLATAARGAVTGCTRSSERVRIATR